MLKHADLRQLDNECKFNRTFIVLRSLKMLSISPASHHINCTPQFFLQLAMSTSADMKVRCLLHERETSAMLTQQQHKFFDNSLFANRPDFRKVQFIACAENLGQKYTVIFTTLLLPLPFYSSRETSVCSLNKSFPFGRQHKL